MTSNNVPANDPQALFQQACDLHQQQQYPQAAAIYQQLLKDFPDALLLLCNYGLLLFETKQYDQACAHYSKAAQLSEDDPDVLYNYALSLKKCGHYEKAEACYTKVLSHTPDDIDCLYNLACCYRDSGQAERAMDAYQQVLTRNPVHQQSLNSLAYLHHKNNDLDRAAELYQQLLAVNPDHPAAQHMVASLTTSEIASVPKSYVRDVFDSYSDHYEESLVGQLQYDVPNTLRAFLHDTLGSDLSFRNGLDLGCGTGLAGASFHDVCDSLTGIDLSAEMIVEAMRKNIYQRLEAIDIGDFLSDKSALYDLIIATDVFGYIGALEETFGLTARAATDSGYFCFSTETTSHAPYIVRKTGRFAHCPTYITTLAEQCGWRLIKSQKTELRKERDGWIAGDLFLFQRTSTP